MRNGCQGRKDEEKNVWKKAGKENYGENINRRLECLENTDREENKIKGSS